MNDYNPRAINFGPCITLALATGLVILGAFVAGVIVGRILG